MSGPQFRPRPGPLWVMLVCLALPVASLLLLLLVMVLTDEVVLLPWQLLLTLVGIGLAANIHAYSGAPKQSTAVTAWELWREPERRSLPVLPPLPKWRVALIYTGVLGLTLAAGVAFSGQDQRRGLEAAASINESSWLRSAADLGFIHVSCRDFPDAGLTEASRCYIWPEGPLAAQKFKSLLTEWVKTESQDSRVETEDGSAVELPFQEKAGFAGGRAQVKLRVYSGHGLNDLLLLHRMTFLIRTGASSSPVPGALTEEAAWLRAQVFPAYFTFTPLK
ncbi:hypothetical protein [Deinococcus navajonensis]|uniref:DUF4131 domain-containing protein n=1 Tax=Deinococcus navajonensis TaxID=309884 RepID=A0ABV8XPA1_9DEIO